MRRLAIVALAASSAASAQVNLLPSTAWGFAPVVSGWHFATPLATSAGAVGDAAQAAVPFQVRVAAGAWSFDVTGAYATGAVHLTSASSSGGNGGFGNASDGNSGDKLVLLNGPTDVKFRLSGPLVEDRLLLVAGINLPTGTTRLNADQLNVLQTISAPGLAMPVPAYGMGTGGTLGLIEVLETAGWTLALGGSLEKRTEYTPIALAVSSGSGGDTRLTPGHGNASHARRGSGRGLVEVECFVIDGYVWHRPGRVRRWRSRIRTDALPPGSSDRRVHETRFLRATNGVKGRSRSRCAIDRRSRTRAAPTVVGSDGNYIDGSLGGVLGGADRTGLVVGVDGRWHSGLPFTSALVGAAATAGGATLGVETRHFRFAVHGQYGTFDTGVSHTTGYGASLSLSFFAGRGQPMSSNIGRRRTVGALFGTLLVLAIACAEKTVAPTAPGSPRFTLQVSTLGRVSQVAQKLVIAAVYFSSVLDSDGDSLRVLALQSVVSSGGAQSLTLNVDLTGCLADQTRRGSQSACSMYVGAFLEPVTFDIDSGERHRTGIRLSAPRAFRRGPRSSTGDPDDRSLDVSLRGE